MGMLLSNNKITMMRRAQEHMDKREELKKEEQYKKEKALSIAKFNLEQDPPAMVAKTKKSARKPRSSKAYGNKHYTNAKGYPRKAQSYGNT